MPVNAADLTKLYLAYFGRPPDFDGLASYAPVDSGFVLPKARAVEDSCAQPRAGTNGFLRNAVSAAFAAPHQGRVVDLAIGARL